MEYVRLRTDKIDDVHVGEVVYNSAEESDRIECADHGKAISSVLDEGKCEANIVEIYIQIFG